MKLSDYLTTKNISGADFAAAIGVNRSTVSRFCHGHRRPDLTTLEKIHRATKGRVTAKDFFADAPSQAAE